MSENRNVGRDRLVEQLQNLAEELGRPPTSVEYSKLSDYESKSLSYHFGSWWDSLLAAGLDPDEMEYDADRSPAKIDPGYTNPGRDGLVEQLQNLAEELGRPPTSSEYRKLSEHSSQSLIYHFGSWEDALLAADLDPDDMEYEQPAPVPKDDLIMELEAAAMALGRPPTSTEMDEYGDYSRNLYRRNFGSWASALEKADLDPNHTELVAIRGYEVEMPENT